MQSEDTSRNPPQRYSKQDILDALPGRHPSWIRHALDHYDGDPEELTAYLASVLPKQDVPVVYAHLGMVLMHAGLRRGAEVFLGALRNGDPQTRLIALDQLRHLDDRSLEREGRPGGLPLTAAELVEALAPTLENPDTEEAGWAVDFCVKHAFPEAKPYLRKLRRHPDGKIAAQVIKRFLEHDCDEGTLDIMAGYLLEPGVRRAKDQGRLLHELSLYLMWWTDERKAAHTRIRAGALAAKALFEALASPNPVERLEAAPYGWFYVEHLLEAVAKARPVGAREVLQRIMAVSGINPIVRAHALRYFVDLTGLVPLHRGAVLESLFSRPAKSPATGGLVQELVQRGLVTLAELLRGTRSQEWCYQATQAIDAWPRGDGDDRLIVRGLRESLELLRQDFDANQYAVGYLVGSLLRSPRTAEDDTAITAGLRETLADIREHHPDLPWHAQTLQGYLLQFGDLAAIDPDTMAPWEAMGAHWKLNGLRWADAARLLAEAGALDPVDPEQSAALDQEHSLTDAFCRLFSLGGDRLAYWIIRDNGYEHHHDELFGKLAGLVRPAVVLEALSQTGEMSFTEVAPDISVKPRGKSRPLKTGKVDFSIVPP